MRRLRPHRPRPPVRSRQGDAPQGRLSDLILAIAGVGFLAALGLAASAALLERTLAP